MLLGKDSQWWHEFNMSTLVRNQQEQAALWAARSNVIQRTRDPQPVLPGSGRPSLVPDQPVSFRGGIKFLTVLGAIIGYFAAAPLSVPVAGGLVGGMIVGALVIPILIAGIWVTVIGAMILGIAFKIATWLLGATVIVFITAMVLGY